MSGFIGRCVLHIITAKFRFIEDFSCFSAGLFVGIDIAYTYNGYVYHTKYDLPRYIPEGCIQRGGENLLGMLTTLANSDKLENPGEARLGKMIFFDLFGFFMVYYPQRIGDIINSLVVLAVLLNLYRKIELFKQTGE